MPRITKDGFIEETGYFTKEQMERLRGASNKNGVKESNKDTSIKKNNKEEK